MSHTCASQLAMTHILNLERLRPSLLQPDDFTNGDFEDFSPPHSNRGSPTSSSRSLKYVFGLPVMIC